MWNNYTVEMVNPDKIARSQAEADAVRLADVAAAGPASDGAEGTRHAGGTRGAGMTIRFTARHGLHGAGLSLAHGVGALLHGLGAVIGHLHRGRASRTTVGHPVG